jgi:hypothetical protein
MCDHHTVDGDGSRLSFERQLMGIGSLRAGSEKFRVHAGKPGGPAVKCCPAVLGMAVAVRLSECYGANVQGPRQAHPSLNRWRQTVLVGAHRFAYTSPPTSPPMIPQTWALINERSTVTIGSGDL